MRLIFRGVRHYRRTYAGLFLGTALAGAILTGALVLGDSADYTLRTYALLRLGGIHSAIHSGERLFSQELGAAVGERLGTHAATALLLPAMAISQDPATGKRTQVNRVQALGVDGDFWAVSAAEGPAGMSAFPGDRVELAPREAAIDERLAHKLGIGLGGTFALRIAKPSMLPRDAPLSSREEEPSQRATLTVKAVLSDARMGRFGLSASQTPPFNVFLSRAELQEHAEAAAKANLLLFGAGASPEEIELAVKDVWKPEHVGLRIARRENGILQLESDGVFIGEPVEKAVLSLPGAQGTLAYLVNGIRKGAKFTPYSFMTAGAYSQGLRDDEIVVNSWLADALAAQTGDRVTVTYYELQPSNQLVERSREFTVQGVVPIEDLALERDLVPDFPGLSDVESCLDWKIGMPMDEALLRDQANEDYWNRYRQTPKAFVTLTAGQDLWGSRYGRLTAVRFMGESVSEETIRGAITNGVDPAAMGLAAAPVREDALRAAAQSNDLGGLFLGMSIFLLVSAFLLTGLLFSLGTQQRAGEVGVLAALGFPPHRIRRLLLSESALIAIPAAVAGAGMGSAYARALLFGLGRYWQDAVGQTRIVYHLEASTLALGAAITVLCALGTTLVTMRRLLRHPARELLSADFTQTQDHYRPGHRRALVTPVVALAAAAAVVAYALTARPEEVTLPFFVSGTLVLVAGILLARHVLARAAFYMPAGVPAMSRTALSNASRRRARSLGVVASLASGCFLVLAVSSMWTDVGAHADRRSAGTGGFEIYAESTVPILEPSTLAQGMPGVEVLGIRVRDGDDASCLNLNRAQTPRVLGVDADQLARLRAFMPEQGENLWERLDLDLGEGVVPALAGDSNTALWGLKKKTGLENGGTLEYRDHRGREVQLQLVGQLPMRLSVFQGAILVSARAFARLWPSEEGFRAFLVDVPLGTPASLSALPLGTSASLSALPLGTPTSLSALPPLSQAEVIQTLDDSFDRYGLESVPAVERLRMFYAVEKTYLNMFLALGGMGLLLGGAATGVVALRNVLERRREIALMHALGFPRRTIFRLLLYEHGMLLGMGAIIGGAAAMVAMLPAWLASGAEAAPTGRITVFLLVLLTAGFCAWTALAAGLRRTDVDALRVE